MRRMRGQTKGAAGTVVQTSETDPGPGLRKGRATITVDPRLIAPGWNSRRLYLVDDGLEESIAELGILQPPTVRELGAGRFEIVHGERRRRAAISLGLPVIEVFVVKLDLLSAQLVNVQENQCRKQLQAWELAEALTEIRDRHQLTHAELARRVKLSAGYVDALIRVRRNLHPSIWAQLREWGDTCKVGWNKLYEISALPQDEQLAEWQRMLDAENGIVRRGRERRPGVAKLSRFYATIELVPRSAEWRAGAKHVLEVALGKTKWRYDHRGRSRSDV